MIHPDQPELLPTCLVTDSARSPPGIPSGKPSGAKALKTVDGIWKHFPDLD